MKRAFFILFLCAVLCGCSKQIEDQLHFNDIEKPFEATFRPDTVRTAGLDPSRLRTYFDPAGSSAEITDPEEYSFRVDELIRVEGTESGDAVRIRSFSAKPVLGVTLEVLLPDFGFYLPVAWIDSLPGFAQFEFPASFTGRRLTWEREDGTFVSFHYPYFDAAKMKPRLRSDDPHLGMLQRIDARWDFRFSNYDWNGTNSSTWREMRPLYAREWVVIVTNYAYMMTTPEYRHVMENFGRIFGGELCDNERIPFTSEKYASERECFLRPFSFVLGQSGEQVGGLGGGGVWGITSWNFYGHYASFSGWEAITHEFMHNMGYGHASNMTYAVDGVGWTEFIWQLHLWLSRKGDLPYLDRNLLGFHKDGNAPYRDCEIREVFRDDAKLEQQIRSFYDKSKLVKYFKENPITE